MRGMWNISQESHLNPAVGNDYHLVKFGQNFEAIFRGNGSLPDNRNTTIEFVITKSSFPQKFGQGFAVWGNYPNSRLLDSFPGCIQRMAPKQVYYEEVAEKEDEILHMAIRECTNHTNSELA